MNAPATTTSLRGKQLPHGKKRMSFSNTAPHGSRNLQKRLSFLARNTSAELKFTPMSSPLKIKTPQPSSPEQVRRRMLKQARSTSLDRVRQELHTSSLDTDEPNYKVTFRNGLRISFWMILLLQLFYTSTPLGRATTVLGSTAVQWLPPLQLTCCFLMWLQQMWEMYKGIAPSTRESERMERELLWAPIGANILWTLTEHQAAAIAWNAWLETSSFYEHDLIVIGEHVVANGQIILGHKLEITPQGLRVMTFGNCTLNHGTIVLPGSVVWAGDTIPAWATLGSGSKITSGSKHPEGAVLMGVPAGSVNVARSEQQLRSDVCETHT